MPAPKLACVAPTAKLVYWPEMVTVTVCPCDPLLGDTEAMEGDGFTVSVAELELTKFVPVVVCPAMEIA
jgi:hypothetical protein